MLPDGINCGNVLGPYLVVVPFGGIDKDKRDKNRRPFAFCLGHNMAVDQPAHVFGRHAGCIPRPEYR